MNDPVREDDPVRAQDLLAAQLEEVVREFDQVASPARAEELLVLGGFIA